MNTNHVTMADVPKSLRELTNPKWVGKVAMAYPIYGTTAGHMARLREAWGDDEGVAGGAQVSVSFAVAA